MTVGVLRSVGGLFSNVARPSVLLVGHGLVDSRHTTLMCANKASQVYYADFLPLLNCLQFEDWPKAPF